MGVAMESEDVTLRSGEQVTVHGLTAMQVALIGKRNAQDNDPDSPAGVAMQIGFAVLGKTKVRDAEAAGAAWLLEHTGGDFTVVAKYIEALSGYGQGAAKSDVPGTGDD